METWEQLSWKKVAVEDFMKGTIEEDFEVEGDHGLLFSLEEIEGDEYELQKDEIGGIQVKAKNFEGDKRCPLIKEKKKETSKAFSENQNFQLKQSSQDTGCATGTSQEPKKKKRKRKRKRKNTTEIEDSLPNSGEQVDIPTGDNSSKKRKKQDVMLTSDLNEAVLGHSFEETQPDKKKKKQKKKKKKNQNQECAVNEKKCKQVLDCQTEEIYQTKLHGKSGIDSSNEQPDSSNEQSRLLSPDLIGQGQLLNADLKEMEAWKPLALHPQLLQALCEQKFFSPTPIQKAALPKAMLEEKDVIGAAETGSGKTLAFGLPLLHTLLESYDRDNNGRRQNKLRALIMTPTRELALQVVSHLKALLIGPQHLEVVAVVGGLAEQKQERLLKRCPEVVVATPGRLWELIHGGNPYLSDLSSLDFLIIDEADRMVEESHFPELEKLFELLRTQEKRQEELFKLAKERIHAVSAAKMSTIVDEKEEAEDEEGFLGSLPGEYEVEMLDDSILQKLEDIKRTTKPVPLEDLNLEDIEGPDISEATAAIPPQLHPNKNVASPESTNQVIDLDILLDEEKEMLANDGIEIVEVSVEEKKRKRQTFVFSATMMLEEAGREHTKGKKWKKMQKANQSSSLKRIMNKIGRRGQPAIVDVKMASPEPKSSNQTSTDKATPILPIGLSLTELKCLQNDKDAYVYYFLLQYPGRTLVFVNAISQARRLTALLQVLNLPVRALHAQMQQRQRLKSMDHIKRNLKAILICTDVAARGLDIPDVEHVIHYDLPRSAEVFIHRSGRTARAQKTGLSLLIASPHDEKYRLQILDVLGKEALDRFPTDSNLLPRARERMMLAVKIVKMDEKKAKASSANSWFIQQAEAMDLDLDQDLLVEQNATSTKDRQLIREAENARKELQAILAVPIFKDKRKIVNIAEKIEIFKANEQKSASSDLNKSKFKKIKQ